MWKTTIFVITSMMFRADCSSGLKRREFECKTGLESGTEEIRDDLKKQAQTVEKWENGKEGREREREREREMSRLMIKNPIDNRNKSN